MAEARLMREIVAAQFNKSAEDIEIQNPDMTGYFIMVTVDQPFNESTGTANTIASSRSSLSANDLMFLIQSTSKLAADHEVTLNIPELCENFGLANSLRRLVCVTFFSGGLVALILTYLIRALS